MASSNLTYGLSLHLQSMASVECNILLLTLQSLHNASENAAIVIQSHFRRLIERRKFLKMMKAICLVQIVTRAWLTVKKNSELNKFSFARVQEHPSGICFYEYFGFV